MTGFAVTPTTSLPRIPTTIDMEINMKKFVHIAIFAFSAAAGTAFAHGDEDHHIGKQKPMPQHWANLAIRPRCRALSKWI